MPLAGLHFFIPKHWSRPLIFSIFKRYTHLFGLILLSEFTVSDELELDTISINAKVPSTYSTYDFIGAHNTIELEQYKEYFIEFKNILNLQAGIDIRSASGVGQYAIPNIRGSQGQQVLVFENGIPVNDLNGSAADIGLISLNGAKKIEVYRGFIPMELSATAIGGAIDVITDLGDRNQGSFKHTTGTYGVSQTTLNQSLVNNNWSISFGLEDSYAENNFIYNELQPVHSPSSPLNEPRYNNATHLQQQYVNTSYAISNQDVLDFKIKNSESNRELAGEINTDENTANIGSDKISYQVIYTHTLKNKSTIRSQYSQSETTELYDDRGNFIGLNSQLNQYITDFNKWNLNYKLPLSSVTINLNQQYQIEKIDVQYLNDENSNNESCYSSGSCDREYTREQFSTGSRLEWALSKDLIWNNQIVYSSTKDDPFSEDSSSNSNDFWSIHSGIKKEVGTGINLSASFNLQYRPPSTSELFGDKGSSVGNPDLISEESESIEINFDYLNLNTEVQGAAYIRDVKNNITAQQDSRGVIKYDNIGKAKYTGLELSAVYNLSSLFQYSAIINYQKSEVTEHTTSGYIGNELNDHRSWFLEQSVRLSYLPYTATMQWSYEKGGYYDTLNYIKRDVKSTASLFLSYTFNESNISFSAYNLTNDRTRTYRHTPVAGRTFYLTINHNWNIE